MTLLLLLLPFFTMSLLFGVYECVWYVHMHRFFCMGVEACVCRFMCTCVCTHTWRPGVSVQDHPSLLSDLIH